MSLDQIRDRYQTYGYVHVPGLLSVSDLAPLRDVIDETVEGVAQRLLEKGLIDNPHRDAPWTRRLAALYRTVKKQSIGWNQEVLSRAVYDLLTFPTLLDIIEALAGPEVQANGDYWLRTKLPHEALTTFPWHQDSFYYGDPTQHLHIISVWIPLIDVDEHNGCMEFLDHSHTWGPVATTRQGDHLGPAVDVETRGHKTVMRMKAGDAVFFHNLTLHRSLMNNSDDVRWSIDLRYAPTGTPTEWLDNIGMLGFVARSRSRPETVESWESWQARRARFTA